MPAPDYAAEIADLESQLASPLTVESQGDRVTQRSTAEIRQSLAYYRGLAAQAAGPARARGGLVVVAFDRE